MRRFSVRSLMALVLMSAVGLAALRNANELWAGTMLLVAYGAVATAVMGALILRRGERYGWAGFAVFSGGYLAIAIGPLLNDVYQSRLGTSNLLTYVYSQVVADSSMRTLGMLQRQRLATMRRIESVSAVTQGPELVALTNRVGKLDAEIAQVQASEGPVNRWRLLLPGAVHHDHFFCVGHSLFALLSGLLGTAVARGFYARRVRDELPVPPSDTQLESRFPVDCDSAAAPS